MAHLESMSRCRDIASGVETAVAIPSSTQGDHKGRSRATHQARHRIQANMEGVDKDVRPARSGGVQHFGATRF